MAHSESGLYTSGKHSELGEYCSGLTTEVGSFVSGGSFFGIEETLSANASISGGYPSFFTTVGLISGTATITAGIPLSFSGQLTAVASIAGTNYDPKRYYSRFPRTDTLTRIDKTINITQVHPPCGYWSKQNG